DTKAVPAKVVASSPAGSSADESAPFGTPLVINGKRVSDNDIKRYLIYGPCRLMLEMYRVSLIIDDELGRRAREHADSVIEPEVVKRARPPADAAVGKAQADKPLDLADNDPLVTQAQRAADA